MCDTSVLNGTSSANDCVVSSTLGSRVLCLYRAIPMPVRSSTRAGSLKYLKVTPPITSRRRRFLSYIPEFFLLFYDILCILFVSRCEGSLGPGFRQVHLTVRLARTKCILCLRIRCVSWASRSRASRHLTVNFSRSRDQVVDTISFALSACFSDLWCWKCN